VRISTLVTVARVLGYGILELVVLVPGRAKSATAPGLILRTEFARARAKAGVSVRDAGEANRPHRKTIYGQLAGVEYGRIMSHENGQNGHPQNTGESAMIPTPHGTLMPPPPKGHGPKPDAEVGAGPSGV
jgi:hypothetical protein